MAKSIGSLTLGSKIKDSNGNSFILIAKNHYGTNEVTLLSETSAKYMQMNPQPSLNLDYPNTEVAYYLNNDYLNTLDTRLANSIKVTSLPYTNALTTAQREPKTVNTKVFILSCTEIGFNQLFAGDGKQIDYVANNRASIYKNQCWTRTEYIPDKHSFYHIVSSSYMSSSSLNGYFNVLPSFNLDSSALVSDNVSNGYYDFIFNQPPVIQTINNINGNYGSATNISYVATDNDDTELTHYISFDNGTKWQEIKPTRNGNIYTYSHVFNELNTYYCRVKVVDSAKNEVVSNAFTITVNAVAPTVNIVSVVDKVVTFKANCITSEISKVEILINGQNVKTFTSGFDFNIVYEIDRNNLNIGKNSIQIKATSQENLVGYANLEASKTKYNLPPVGTKVIIGGIEYSISNASEDGSNQTYTLNSNLINQIKKGDIVQIIQDSVKVLCSMSNLENVKDYKEMKLVKTKKLKGDLKGYIEEKYELQGEGRYSTIKLEMQRFNNNVSTEVLELQQYFDYLEDVNIEFGGFEDNDSDGGSNGGSSENIPVTDINCNDLDVKLEVGQTKQITANVVPSNATNKLIHWYSDNTLVADVSSSGLITAKGVGYSKVTATTDDGGYKCDIHVNVTASVGGGSGGENTPPINNSDYDARVLSLMYPMPQSHECIPSGAPSDWKYQSRWENKDKPVGWSAFGGWAQIYRVDGTPFTQNTGVEMKNYKVFGWKNGQWHSVVELPYVTGNFYAEDFTDDANTYFSNGIKPSDDRSSVIIRLTSDMTISTSKGTKNVCYHPFTAQLDYDANFEYIFTCVSMRKVKWDANGVDDMSTSRYCASCGGDWWRQKGLTWAPDWSNNKGIAQPKITEVTTDWQVFSMTTAPQGWSHGFPI